ncbi:MAG: bifunctional pyr operon transcriptional regulator/uracil phosphoribosyltransferase PyrR [Phycisphaerales bacterium]
MQQLADAKKVALLIDELAAKVAGAMTDHRPWAVVGIRRRGDALAQRLARRLKPDFTGAIDITLYRDDLSEVGPQPQVRTTDINFDLDNCNILLVDDVLMSGRSVRAALQSLLDFGRPRCVKLAVLVDRGGRELPICPDFVGLSINTDETEHVRVRLEPTDPSDQILLMPKPPNTR